jgi:hypothetical protein
MLDDYTGYSSPLVDSAGLLGNDDHIVIGERLLRLYQGLREGRQTFGQLQSDRLDKAQWFGCSASAANAKVHGVWHLFVPPQVGSERALANARLTDDKKEVRSLRIVQEVLYLLN